VCHTLAFLEMRKNTSLDYQLVMFFWLKKMLKKCRFLLFFNIS
jgi:para-nitrobenzyl esterase